MLGDLVIECRVVGLDINSSKTKLLAKGEATKEILAGDLTINFILDYKYLGRIISFDKRFEKEIAQRISNAWKSFRTLKVVFRSKFNLEKRMQILNSVVISFYPMVPKLGRLRKN